MIVLSTLLATPAEAVVKTYYAQQSSCGTNYNSGLVWQAAAETSSTCSTRSRIGSRDATGDFLVAVTPPFASETTITGQTGSNIYFNEQGRGSYSGRVRFVEVNAAGDAILGDLTGTATINVPDTGSATLTNLSGLSGTISAGNRLGFMVYISANGVEPQFFFGQDSTSTGRAWFVVDEVVANSAPTITVNQPDGVGDSLDPGNIFTINYNLADSDNAVTAAFYYDTNNSGLDGTAITGACAAAPEGTGATCSWDTTGVPSGDYYVYGIANDGINPAVSDYSAGPVTINACTESISSSIIWNGTSSASGDFNGSSFITANDVNTLQYQVTEGGGSTPGTDTFYYNGASNFSSPVTVAGTTTNVFRGCSTGGTTVIPGAPQIASAGGAWDSCTDNRYRYNGTGPVQWIMADTEYGADTTVTGRSNTPIVYRGSNCSIQLNLGYVSSGTFTSFGSSPVQNLNTTTWTARQFDLSGVSGTVPAGATVAVEVDITANGGDCRFAYGSGQSNSGTFTVDTLVGGETTVIPWTADTIPAIANLIDGNTYNLYARGTENECSVDTYYGDSVANTTPDGTAQSFTWTNAPPNIPATLAVNEPNGSGDTVAEGGNFTINYDLADTDDTATISFFYETDGNGAGGTEIGSCSTQPEATGGTCVWNTSGVAPGNYYVYGTTSGDGAGAATAISSGTMRINDTVTLSVNQPDGTGDTIGEGSNFTINYNLSDSDDATTVAFFYDSDNSPGGGTAIGGCAAEPEATGGACVWNTIGVAPGSYYVYGTTSGDWAGASTVYSSGTMTINDAPALSIAEPNGTGDTVTVGSVYNISYTLTDSDSVVTANFFYDNDNAGFNGTAIGGSCTSAAEGSGVTCAWDTSGVTPGSYYVYGTSATDGFNSAAQAYSPGMITISSNNVATLSVNEPNGTADTFAEGSASYTINYDLSDSDDVTTIAFFYDTNNSGADGTAIAGCGNEPEATGGTCTWNTSGLAAGSYYVYATTSGDGAGVITVYSAGTMTINEAPALSIAEPNGTGDTVSVGNTYNITYTLTDSDDTVTVDFYYDTNAVGFNGTAISGACVNAPEGNGVSCAWDTTDMAVGSYYVYGISTTDGFNSAAQAYSPGMITIAPNSAATLSVNQPDGVGDMIAEGGNFTINYNLSDSDDVASVSFFYETDGNGSGGTPISGCSAQPEATGGTCVWNTNGVAPGNYYVYGTTSGDGAGAATVVSSGTMRINDAAELSILEPNGAGDTIAEGASFTLNYNLSDNDDVTTVAFFYDTNNSGADGTAINGCAARPEATGGSCTWNTSGVAPGSYYVYGKTSGDGSGTQTVYSAGPMTINDAPALSISEPNGSGDTVGAGNLYNITYTLTDSDSTITAKFYYDTNASGFDGTAINGACATAPEGNGVSCSWDTSGMPFGSYYVYGITTTDGYNSPAQAYSPGPITIIANSAATLSVNQPDGVGDSITEGNNFTINYDLADSDDVTTVAFFYDTDNNPGGGTAIGSCAAEPEATGGTCVWNTSGVTPGNYYIFGTTSGDGVGPATVYSTGTVTISLAPLTYLPGDDGTYPRGGDNIAGISRSGGGDDYNNLQSGKWKINVEYEFKIRFIDSSGESPLVEPVLYLAHRNAPTEGAGGDFFAYPLVCTGVNWVSGKTCATTMKLGPAAAHKFYFYAQKTDGSVVRKPSSGYTDGPDIQLINGYSLAGVARDINGSNYDARAALNTPYGYGWASTGLDSGAGTFNGGFVAVTSSGSPAESGRGYYVHKWRNTLPALETDADVTAATHTIALNAGWNMISNPYNGNVKLEAVQVRQNGTTTNSWSNAAAANWVEPAIYYYLGKDWGNSHASEFGPDAELVPWMGYWMYVKNDANSYELIIAKPAQ